MNLLFSDRSVHARPVLLIQFFQSKIENSGRRAAHRMERAVRQEGAPFRGQLRHGARRRLLRTQLPRHELVSATPHPSLTHTTTIEAPRFT